jgi:ABC-2 type transport system ATP-binding protein
MALAGWGNGRAPYLFYASTVRLAQQFIRNVMVTFSSITKVYGRTTAVDDVSLTIEKGEFLALLGPNGAGKSTLVKMLLDFVKPTRGSVSIGGVDGAVPGARQGVGYLAENLRIPPHLSGAEFLRRHASLCGLEGKVATDEADRVVELVGMRGKERDRAGTYSKGMTQRIGLGAALLGTPRLLVLDEPANGLDPIGMREVRVILESLRQQGVTIVLNSHLLSEVEKTCTTAAIMNRGAIVARGAIGELVRDGETLEDVFVRVVVAGTRG